jgi:hypothetical protein
MPATGTPTTETLSSPPPLRPQRRAATAAAGLIVFSAVTLTPWLLTTGSHTESSAMTPHLATQSPLQAARPPVQASAGSDAGSIAPAYAFF